MTHDDLEGNLIRYPNLPRPFNRLPRGKGESPVAEVTVQVVPDKVRGMTGAAKRIALEVAGWTLLLVGIAAIPLPGPGLLGVFAGLALLSRQYDWADRRVEPVRLRALRGAAESVETAPRILLSCLAALVLGGFGVLWILGPEMPSWWPLPELFWLPGGIWTGVTQVASAIFALGFIAYSYRRFHDNQDEIDELDKQIEALHKD
jgi:uncharacterized protein (TIGR02611 family)